MAILEAGVMFSGVPIVKVNYYNEQSTNSMLTAGLLEAIQKFAEEIFADETESFRMKKNCIFLNNVILESKQKVILYFICDKLDKPIAIKDALNDLAKAFKENFSKVDMGCLENYTSFGEIINKELGDLIYKPEDRLRKVFSLDN